MRALHPAGILAVSIALASCSGAPTHGFSSARIRNGHISSHGVRYHRDTRACSANSLQLLSSGAIDSIIDGWQEPAADCEGPEKVGLPVKGDYPTGSVRKRQSGSAHVLVRLDENGRIDSVRAVCATDEAFGTAAVETVAKIRFAPMTCNGTPTRIAFFLPLDYDI